MTDVKSLVPPPTAPKKIKRVSLEGVPNSRVERYNYRGNGHWLFDKNMNEDKAIGFIYLIRNNINGMLYLGKKQYKSAGKVTKGKESNWPWYITSCKELASDIKNYGKDSFDFICIEEYKMKGALAWAETWSLVHVEIPLNRDIWYNTLIPSVAWVVREEVTEKHIDRLMRVVKGEI